MNLVGADQYVAIVGALASGVLLPILIGSAWRFLWELL